MAPTFLRMRHTSASSIFDASAAAQLSSRPEGGGVGLVLAVGAAVEKKSPLRPCLRKGGVRWAFLFVLREGRRPVEPSLPEGSSETRKLPTAGPDVKLRERHVAGLAPAVPGGLGDPEPLFQKLAVPFQRLQSVVQQQREPAPAQEQVPVSVPQAPPAEVQALLAVLLAEPVALPQPPVPGEALRLLQEVPVSLARPIA